MQNARNQQAGLGFALLSAATFGSSGTFATSLEDSGWSPAAAVTARIVIAALVLTAPALYVLRGKWALLLTTSRSTLPYGLIAVAACQLCYFNAVQRLSVGVALLLEYLGILLVVCWLWIRHGRRPRRLTVAGSVAAIFGLILILNLTGTQRLDLVGVLWGLGAAVGLAVYFVLSADTGNELPPIAFAWAGMVVGGVSLMILGAVRAVPLRIQTGPVQFLHYRTSWLVPVLGLSLIAAVVSYAVGIRAARLLGAKLASFVGLSEVLFAVLFAWLLLGQLPRNSQLLGGVFIVGGVALVRIDELRKDAAPETASDPVVTADPLFNNSEPLNNGEPLNGAPTTYQPVLPPQVLGPAPGAHPQPTRP